MYQLFPLERKFMSSVWMGDTGLFSCLYSYHHSAWNPHFLILVCFMDYQSDYMKTVELVLISIRTQEGSEPIPLHRI